jgi:hypothetical protein
MTMLARVQNRCAVCGAINMYTDVMSTNSFGSPDLDLRPAEMERSTMGSWIQACPKCGYVSKRISDQTYVSKLWLQSEKYLTCDGIPFVSDLAKIFYRYYLLNSRKSELEDAFFSILHAAWACDDANDDENAKHCREIGIVLGRLLIEENCADVDKIKLICADLMRRAGKFDQLISTYESVHFDDDLHNQILKFQIEKAKARDVSCYRVGEVTGGKL